MDLTDKHEMVCFCNFVTVGEIQRSIDQENLKSVPEVMEATGASTTCGSCYDNLCAVVKAYQDKAKKQSAQ